jgi:hypothetical protein
VTARIGRVLVTVAVGALALATAAPALAKGDRELRFATFKPL